MVMEVASWEVVTIYTPKDIMLAFATAISSQEIMNHEDYMPIELTIKFQDLPRLSEEVVLLSITHAKYSVYASTLQRLGDAFKGGIGLSSRHGNAILSANARGGQYTSNCPRDGQNIETFGFGGSFETWYNGDTGSFFG
jgi:hypothetical protein